MEKRVNKPEKENIIEQIKKRNLILKKSPKNNLKKITVLLPL